MSVSSGLSVAVPKYFLPAALATLKSPALEVPLVVDSEDSVDDAGALMFFSFTAMQFYRQTS